VYVRRHHTPWLLVTWRRLLLALLLLLTSKLVALNRRLPLQMLGAFKIEDTD
jgi:hypothetical protein